jgi:low temperature requirement protein LtrA
MSEHTATPHTKRSLIVPMRARSPHETHRAATPLELFFDLVFVVAVAQAASSLHHGLAEDHVWESIVGFIRVFFGIWWAWMNFTWFASAYDTDDVPYRLAVFVQIAGALILAAGVPAAFDEGNFTVVILGYVVMRLSLVAQWIRAGRSDPAHKETAYRYAIGVIACQIAWVSLLFFPALGGIAFPILVVAELLVPVWAERKGPTPWHPEHISERYGLFTIIVLGESILSASLAIQSASTGEGNTFSPDLLPIIFGGLLIVFAMWWLYFDQPIQLSHSSSVLTAFAWGYSHYFIFAAAAAVGAGLAVVMDQVTHHAEINATVAGLTVAVPVIIYLMGLWALHQQPHSKRLTDPVLFPATAVLILLTPFTFAGQAVPLIGALLVALLSVKMIRRYRASASAQAQ